MPKFNFIQNALIGGEVTPLAKGRTDYPQYKNSLEDCVNMLPFVAGGAVRRPSTRLLNKVDTGHLNLDGAVDAFIPLELSSGGRYMVCLGGSDAARVVNVNTNATTYLDSVTDESALAVGTFLTNYTKYSTIQAHNAQYCQVGDVLYIVSQGKAPMIIKFDGTTSASDGTAAAYTVFSNFLSGGFKGSPGSNAANYARIPYRPVNLSATTITSSNTALGATSLTASTSFFNAGHVNTYFKMAAGAIFITGYTSGTQVAGTIVDALTAGTATTVWEEGAWSDYRGWPRTVGFYENRLVYGGNDAQPDSLWFSEDGDVVQFSLTIGGTPADTDGFAVTPSNAEKVSKINWMITGINFAFGTGREEFTVVRPDVQAGFSITNIQIKKQTSRGSRYIQAVRIESALYFVDASGSRIVEFVFDERENSYRNRDINLFADHMPAKWQELFSSPRSRPSISRMCKQSDADQRLWVMDEAGGLFSCVIDRMFNANAWSMHFLGGNGPGGDTNPAPFVRSMCAIENTGHPTAITTGRDVLWLSTGRTVNSAFENYVEYIDHGSDDEDDYLDFRLASSVAAVTQIFTANFASFASSGQGDYFFFQAPARTYAVWLDKDANGTAPTGAVYVSAAIQIKASITSGMTDAQVANAVNTALGANATFASDGLTASRPNTDDNVAIVFPAYIAPSTSVHNTGDTGDGSITLRTTYAGEGGNEPSVYVREPGEAISQTVAGTAVSGLTHLKNEVVDVVADGIYVGQKTVSATGTFTLSIAATQIEVGYPYKSKIKTLPIEAGSQIGSAFGSLQRIDQARVHFYRTANASFASAENYENDVLEEILFRPAATPSDEATPLFTGYKVLDFSHDYERGAQLIVETDGPLAMTITHVTLRGQTYD